LACQARVSIGIGIGEAAGKAGYSSYVLVEPDGGMGVHRKTRWQTSYCPIDPGKKAVAHNFAGQRVGIMICAEAGFRDVAQTLAEDRAELLVMPFAYGETLEPKVEDPTWRPITQVWQDDVTARSRETGLPAIVVAATGFSEKNSQGVRYSHKYQGGCALVHRRGLHE